MPHNNTMITVFVRDCNISQSFYDSVLYGLQIHQLGCPVCRHSACLSVHGYYFRTIAVSPEPFRLRVLRVRCAFCRATHAILLSSMVPYSRIPFSDQLAVIYSCQQHEDRSRICDLNPAVDENNVKSIIRSFRRHWEQKLLSLRISLAPVRTLVFRCFSDYSMQFMQIRRIPNVLFLSTT